MLKLEWALALVFALDAGTKKPADAGVARDGGTAKLLDAGVEPVPDAGPKEPFDGGPPQVIDWVVAAVEGWAITRHQQDVETRVLLVLGGAGPTAARGELDSQIRERALTQMIDERLLTLNADKVGAFPVSDDELREELANFEKALGPSLPLSRFFIENKTNLASIEEVLRRHFRATKILDNRFRLRSLPDEQEIAQARAARPALAGLSEEAVRREIRRERFAALVEEHLLTLRHSADVRFFPAPEDAEK